MLPQISVAKAKDNQVSKDISGLVAEYLKERASVSELGEILKNFEGPFSYFASGNKLSRSYTTFLDTENALKALDSEYWKRAIALTDMMDYMSANERSEWHAMVSDFKAPEFNQKNLFATLDKFINSRGELLARKVDGIFRSLSGTHVTNNPMAFSKRMIINNTLDNLGYPNYRVCELLDDLRMVIAKHMGRDSTDFAGDTRQILRVSGPGSFHEIDGGALRIKIYKIGTMHLEVHPEIALYLNEVLAALYPTVIAKSSNRGSKEPTLKTHEPLKRNFLKSDVATELMRVSERGSRGGHYTKNSEVIEILEYLGSIQEDSHYFLPDESLDGLHTIIRMGCYPDKEAQQFYPTQSALAKMAVSKIGKIESWEKVLEPSAGQGGIADYLPKASTTCVEIDPVNASILKNKGFTVLESDFMTLKFDAKFDKIVMNPPFTKGQALSHLKRAISHLAPDGELVAILPASMIGKDLGVDASLEWSDPIEGQFEGTGVVVTVLHIKK